MEQARLPADRKPAAFSAAQKAACKNLNAHGHLNGESQGDAHDKAGFLGISKDIEKRNDDILLHDL